MHTPLGLLWVDGALYVSSHERVDAYQDFDGTKFASSTNIVTLPAGVGENNGLVRSPGGRILLGISAPCDACTPASEYSAAIVSFARTAPTCASTRAGYARRSVSRTTRARATSS